MQLLLPAFATAFLESPIAAYLLRRKDDFLYILVISALVNLLTNLLLNAFCLPLLAKTALSALWDGRLSLLLAELVVACLPEGVLYRVLIRDVSPGLAMLVSALGNTVSLGAGLIVSAAAGTEQAALLRGFAILCAGSGLFCFVSLAAGLRVRRKKERRENDGKR